MKTKTITLTHGYWDDDIKDLDERHKVENRIYKVEKITDCADYYPGQLLKKKEVQELCASSSWKVTIAEKRS